ncbi:S-layer homology domain-containing protein [Oceanobacillus damuensis]|uniref:S-layer homology domain-containing protein n=1 Tax=Oceanobacillus damuensis TaxID=937928 RepID=UPI00082E4B5E|nr:S-layer homology domain-containing protein [Oceanobacillus damuensis]
MAKQKTGRKVFSTTAAAAMAATAVIPTATLAADVSFPDVENDNNNNWYKDSVDYLASQGYIQGDQNGNFNPKDFIKRHSAAEVLRKALDLSTEGTEDFSDVTTDDWFYESVVAVSPEIFQGDGYGNFMPEKVLTRQEAAVAIVDAYGMTGEAELTFADSDNIASWAKEAAEIALENGVITGKPDNLFAPTDEITRAEFAVMVKRASEASDLVPEVASVSAIDADTLEVTLSNGEVVTVDLTDVVLEVNVETEVTFTIDGVEYTELVTYVPDYAALAEAEIAELEGITIETISDLEVVADAVAAAEEAVALVEDADVQAALQARIDAVVEANEATLADVVASVNNATTQVQLNNALQAFFNNVNSNLITQYDNVLDGTEVSVEEIQADINNVNVVSAVAAATNQIELLEALNNNGFESVNPDLIAEYAAVITGDETTIAEIQTDIDLVNAEATVDALLAVDGSLAADQAEIDAAQDLVTALVDAGVLPASNDLQVTIDNAQDLLDIQVAIEEAQAAVAALVDANGNLAADQAEINEAQELVDALVAQGVTLPDADNDGTIDVQELINEAQALLVTEVTETVAALVDAEGNLVADQTEIDEAQELVDALVAAGESIEVDTNGDGVADTTLQAQIDAAQASLYAQIEAQVTADIEGFVDADGNVVATQADLEATQELIDVLVAAEQPIDVDTDGDGVADTTLQAQLDEIQDLLAVQNIYAATTATELQPLLVNLLNTTTYSNLTLAQRVEVANQFLDVLANNDYATTGEIATSLDLVADEYNTEIIAVNDATTISATDTALEALDIPEYEALTAAQQLVAAEAVLNNKPETGYTTIAQLVEQF